MTLDRLGYLGFLAIHLVPLKCRLACLELALLGVNFLVLLVLLVLIVLLALVVLVLVLIVLVVLALLALVVSL